MLCEAWHLEPQRLHAVMSRTEADGELNERERSGLLEQTQHLAAVVMKGRRDPSEAAVREQASVLVKNLWAQLSGDD